MHYILRIIILFLRKSFSRIYSLTLQYQLLVIRSFCVFYLRLLKFLILSLALQIFLAFLIFSFPFFLSILLVFPLIFFVFFLNLLKNTLQFPFQYLPFSVIVQGEMDYILTVFFRFFFIFFI